MRKWERKFQAQEVVFGQRPATAIGFSSTSFSGMSTPEQTARSMDDRVKVNQKLSMQLKSEILEHCVHAAVCECCRRIEIKFEYFENPVLRVS